MQNLSILILLSAVLLFESTVAGAFETIAINTVSETPLFDGRCDEHEWQAATRIELPAEVSVYLMHDNDSLFVCTKGKTEDYTVIDIYIEHAETGHLHNLHASAQLGELIFKGKEWSQPEWWNHKDWSAFWVPYAGDEDTENGKRTRFLQGSHREVQVLRKKFVGDTWNIMIGISAVKHEGSFGAELFFPEGAVDTDKSTWGKFSFSE